MSDQEEQQTQHAPAFDALLHLARRARHAESSAELGFILVNETFAIAPFRQAALWLDDSGVIALSGVVAPEANAPFVHWLDRVASQLAAQDDAAPRLIDPNQLSSQDAAEWDEWLPAQALWLPIALTNPSQQTKSRGGLILAKDEAWAIHDLPLLAEWLDVWSHAWMALHKPSHTKNFLRWLQRPRMGERSQEPLFQRISQLFTAENLRKSAKNLPQVPRKIWQSPKQRYTALALICLCIPVRLSVLVPGELVPAQPAAIRSPIEGTIDRFFVTPNAVVKAGDLLFQLDATSLNSKLEVAQEGLATAEAEYRQAAQQAVFDPRSKVQLSTLQGRIAERSTEVEFVKSQLARTRVTAPKDGIALVDDPTEWIGKPVTTGEKVMIVADEHDVEVEAWLSPADMIDFPVDATVTLYLNSSPLDPIHSSLRYVAHEATPRPDGTFAYRLRAKLPPDAPHPRVGLKGTSRASGHFVPAFYWILRRPIASIRPLIGI